MGLCAEIRPVGVAVLLLVLCAGAATITPVALAWPQSDLPSSSPIVLTIRPSLADSSIHLPDQFIAAGSDTLTLDSVRILRRDAEYRLNYRSGTLSFDAAFIRAVLSDTTRRVHTVSLRYQYFPFHFKEVYSHRELVSLKDSTGTDTLRVARPRSTFSMDDIFGPQLQKSGSISRGFTVGSNRDLSLNSGLRLQLSGKIASDIDIAAALTDENTPIQPEGTTQTLQEFDKVFVEIKSTNMAATLGDFNLDLTGSEFASVSRKLQGAEGTANYNVGGANGTIAVGGAITRGKYATNQLSGIEGVQGPYILTGRNQEPSIIVIAGTEHVYIDGELQTRGETNDYTIDYSTGQITFMPRRLITAASRIVVDFQYTDRQYSRSLLATKLTSNVFNDMAKFSFSFLREADDQDSPIDFAINDSARQALAAAGNDRSKAVLSGVTQVDSNGYYIRVDTVLPNGTAAHIYRYAPGDPAAKFNVTFSFVGFGKGDYSRPQPGVFVWNGPGTGEYLPIRILPMPQLQQVLDAGLNVSPVRDLTVGGEVARSVFDGNRFSALSRLDDAGNAYNVTAAYAPKKVSIGRTDLGSFDLSLHERYVDRRFVPIDRTNDIEFNRKWAIDSVTSTDERIREASLKYSPVQAVMLGTGYGRIVRGSDIQSTRNDATLRVQGPGLPLVNYYMESVRSREAITDNAGSWLRQNGSIEYTLWKLTPSFRYLGENRKLLSMSTSAVQPGSLRYDVLSPGLKLTNLGNLSLSADYEWRNDNAFNLGTVVPQSRSFTQSYSARLTDWHTLGSTLDVTLRKRSFSQDFKLLGNTDVNTVLVRNQTRYSPFNRALEADLYYETSTERSSKLARVFVKVAPGSGNFIYLGDLNHNGLADDVEFEEARFDGDYVVVTLPTDELFPIIDLKSSARVRFTPSRLLSGRHGFLDEALSAISTETYGRVDEKSTEQDLKQIYLLHFSRFQRDSTTIAGTNVFTQDLYLFEGQPMFSSRFRFSEQHGLNNFSGGIERTYTRERSVRVRWQLVTEISNQIDYVNKADRLSSSLASNRARNIQSDDVTFDLSYRPEQNLEVGFKVEAGKSTDYNPVPPAEANLNVQSLRWIYAFQGAGQLRIESSREEITLRRAPALFPYELTEGRVEGKTWLWQIAFDYRVTQFLQATVNYNGRSEGGAPPVHTARAEVRAFF